MCLISVGEMPKEDILRRAQESNSDGIGVAWPENDGVRYMKDLTVNELLKLPKTVKENIAIHFRWASVGGKSKDLIHPFPVSRDVPLKAQDLTHRVLMHNGHISQWQEIFSGIEFPDKKPVSDSRFLAYVTWKWGVEAVRRFFPGNKILLLSKKKVTLIGSWEKEEGTYYSNTSYKWGRKDWSYSGSEYGGCGYRGNSSYSGERFDQKTQKWVKIEPEKEKGVELHAGPYIFEGDEEELDRLLITLNENESESARRRRQRFETWKDKRDRDNVIPIEKGRPSITLDAKRDSAAEDAITDRIKTGLLLPSATEDVVS